MNDVSLIGNLTRGPELRSAKSGHVCQLRVAVDNPGRGGSTG
jgi:single-stranded DNA-binding protein